VAEHAVAEGEAGASAGVRRTRAGIAAVAAVPGRSLRRLRRHERSTTERGPEFGEASPVDEVPASPPDLADADVSVQRAWKHLRLTIAILVAVAPVVTALISWRIRVWRARRSGQPIDP
jgi:hypothetical protein